MSKQEMPESGGFEYLNPMEKKELLEGAWEANGWIEERFSLRKPTRSHRANAKKRRRLAPLEMTVLVGSPEKEEARR